MADTPSRSPKVAPRDGIELLRDALHNNDGAFTPAKRNKLKLRGALPAAIQSIEVNEGVVDKQLRCRSDVDGVFIAECLKRTAMQRAACQRDSPGPGGRQPAAS